MAPLASSAGAPVSLSVSHSGIPVVNPLPPLLSSPNQRDACEGYVSPGCYIVREMIFVVLLVLKIFPSLHASAPAFVAETKFVFQQKKCFPNFGNIYSSCCLNSNFNPRL
jgi:hypothetical protein